jgi:hypothetical protein
MEEYLINDFGKAQFEVKKKGFKSDVIAFGTITGIEKKVVEFTDNDGFAYLIDKKDFKFEKHIFKAK